MGFSFLSFILLLGGCSFAAAEFRRSGVSATNPNCYAECSFDFVDKANKVYTFDFSSLCGDEDYQFQDSAQHTYYANICGRAKKSCLPQDWSNTYQYGVAVQEWGGTPACTPPGECQDKGTSDRVCCTKDCQVLGVGQPIFEVIDDVHPDTGGVMAHFKGAPPTEFDPFYCPYNPTTGAQYERQVTFHFQCDPSATSLKLDKAMQNQTNDCHYRLYFLTNKACITSVGPLPPGSMPWGWAFMIYLFSFGLLYVGIGGLLQFQSTGEVKMPNQSFWIAFTGLIDDGYYFLISCGELRAPAHMASDYDTLGRSSGDGGPSYQNYDSQPAKQTDMHPSHTIYNDDL